MKVIILAGGGGTRLFPISRTALPKQFLSLDDDKTLLGLTIERFAGICEPEDIVVVTGEKYIFQVKQELKKSACQEGNVIAEPCARNTAPAIALAVKFAIDKLGATNDEPIFVAPADHIISPVEDFQQKVIYCCEASKQGAFVTMGIKPDRPEIGYGYIEAKELCGNGYKVDSFKEKPNRETAEKYVESGCYYWNSGMFCFTSQIFIDELKQHGSDLYTYMTQGTLEQFLKDFGTVKSISIDYAIAEKSSKIVMIPIDIYWNDVGSWDSIYDHYEKDENGNIQKGDTRCVDCSDSMFLSNNRLILGVGLKDVYVVETDDVIMVARKGESQKVKELYDGLKDRLLAHEHTTTERPWGNYTILSESRGYKVKKIVVYPGQKLSLQLHHRRSEHWVITSGVATIVIGGDDARTFRKNESVYVPKETKHRLMNMGDEDLEIIEVQNGEYLGEDDIVRFDDVYKRIG